VLTIIIIVILLIVSALSIVFYQNIQMERVVQVRVDSDKDVFSSDENVTFKLTIQNPGKEFDYVNYFYNAPPSGWDGNYGVFVHKISDSVSPSDFVRSFKNNGTLTPNSHDVGFVQIARISSDNCSLELVWNRTIYDDSLRQYLLAPSGQYCLVPYMPRVQFNSILDEGNFFKIKGLEITISAYIEDVTKKLMSRIMVRDATDNGITTSIDVGLNATANYSLDPEITHYLDSNFTLKQNGSRTFYIGSTNEFSSYDVPYISFFITVSITTPEGQYVQHLNGSYSPEGWQFWN
jgi:hypothetical protein